MTKLPVLYVGCALTYATDEYKASTEQLKALLRKGNFEVLDFIGLIGGTSKDVVLHDIERCVGGCDFFVALADGPSCGLGLEVGAALWKFQKPTLILAQTEIKVTRAFLGLPEAYPETAIACARYAQMTDIPTIVSNHWENLQRLRIEALEAEMSLFAHLLRPAA